MKNLFVFAILAGLSTACVETDSVEAPTLTYGQELRAGGGGPTDCSTVYCLTVECPDGFERRYTPNDCCGTCVQINPSTDGYCNNAVQCEGLVHIECVGDWTCDSHVCNYTCDTSEVE
jgi:hypothetical protein